MKRILVPIDFSECSEYALEAATDLAKQNDSEIVVLHMLGISEAIFTKNEAQEFMEAQYYLKLAKKRFSSFLNHDYLKNIKISQMVQNYKIFGEINHLAKEQNIDLIVMGSHGASGLSEFFVGSNTEKVVRTSNVPVLVIKVKRPRLKIKKVVFGFDFQIESIPAYHKAIKLFATLKTEVHLLHVNRPGPNFLSNSELESKIKTFLGVAHHGSLPGHACIKKTNDYTVEQGIYDYARNIEANLIAIITHGRSGLSHFFKGSIGEDIANHAQLPVMTFKI